MNIKAALGPNGRDKRFSGFTIVELLVSLGLVIFIMSLVSTIFVIATKSFRDMKAAGDLSEQLRSAGQLIRGMIKAEHFTNNAKPSEELFWKAWNPSGTGSYVNQGVNPLYTDAQLKDATNTFNRAGFLRFDQNAPSLSEGQDLDNIPVAIANQPVLSGIPIRSCDHRLSMTVLLNGSSPSDLFSAFYDPAKTSRPAFLNTIGHKYFERPELVRRPFGELALFLAATDVLDAPKTGLLSGDPVNLPLYSLHMKTWLIRDANDPVGTLDPQLSFSPNTNTWNTLGDLTNPFNRASKDWLDKNMYASRFSVPLAPVSLAPSFPVSLDSLILRNVISFEVQLLDSTGTVVDLGNNGFYDTSAQANWIKTVNGNATTYSPVTGSWVANTNNPTSLAPLRIFALKIILRVYDPDNEITRQMTIIEPL